MITKTLTLIIYLNHNLKNKTKQKDLIKPNQLWQHVYGESEACSIRIEVFWLEFMSWLHTSTDCLLFVRKNSTKHFFFCCLESKETLWTSVSLLNAKCLNMLVSCRIFSSPRECVNVWMWMTVSYFPWIHEDKNKGTGIPATRCHCDSAWRRCLPAGLGGGPVAVANSLVSVLSCCTVPSSDNNNTVNEAPVPCGFTERSVMLSVSLSPRSPCVCANHWGEMVGLHWWETMCWINVCFCVLCVVCWCVSVETL